MNREKYQSNISGIQIVPIHPRDGLVAFCAFQINDSFRVGNVAIYTSPSSPGGFRLVYPKKLGVFCFRPLNHEAGDYIQQEVISTYLRIIKKLTGTDDDEFCKKEDQ